MIDTSSSPRTTQLLTLDERLALFRLLPNLNGLTVHDVPRDGDCCLHAMLDQLADTSSESDEMTCESLRNGAIAILRQRPASESLETVRYKDWNTYLEKQSLSGEWLDELMIRALSDFLHREILIYHCTGCITTIQPSTSTTFYINYESLRVGQIAELHYVSLRKSPVGQHVEDCTDEKQSIVADSGTLEHDTTANDGCVREAEVGEQSFANKEENTVCEDTPDCWSAEQQREFIDKHKWLIVNQKHLGCSICRDVNALGPLGYKGMRLSKEWVATTVTCYGDTKAKQQMSLRKKISDHKESEMHKRAVIVQSNKQDHALQSVIGNQSQNNYETTSRVFRTVYKEVKLDRPFTDLESDVDLQILNGLNMGQILHSNVTCGNIARHIGQEMRKKVLRHVLGMHSQKISILMDESTTVSHKTALIVYIRTVIRESDEPVTFFIDLVELSSQSAEHITTAILDCLSKFGMTRDVLKNRLVGFACDGASVMLGRTGGVAARLLELFPGLIVWHCFAHRLELSVGDTVKEISGINSFKIFMDKLYSIYSMSTKNRVEL